MYFGSQAPYTSWQEVKAAGPWRNWSPHIHTQEAETARVFVLSSLSPRLQSSISALENVPPCPPPPSVQVFPLQLMRSIKAPTGMPSGLPLG